MAAFMIDRWKNRERAKFVEFTCTACGGGFSVVEYRVRDRERRGGSPLQFCSRQCSNKSRTASDAEVWESFRRRLDENAMPEPNSGCHLWTGKLQRSGYAATALRGKYVGWHRIAWQLAHGSIPKGQHVLHKCDVPSCVNPAHLWLGTHTDNMADKKRKGRNRNGWDNLVALPSGEKIWRPRA